jgi:hypothetical protein
MAAAIYLAAEMVPGKRFFTPDCDSGAKYLRWHIYEDASNLRARIAMNRPRRQRQSDPKEMSLAHRIFFNST